MWFRRTGFGRGGFLCNVLAERQFGVSGVAPPVTTEYEVDRDTSSYAEVLVSLSSGEEP
jgi:hypothetical protein